MKLQGNRWEWDKFVSAFLFNIGIDRKVLCEYQKKKIREDKRRRVVRPRHFPLLNSRMLTCQSADRGHKSHARILRETFRKKCPKNKQTFQQNPNPGRSFRNFPSANSPKRQTSDDEAGQRRRGEKENMPVCVLCLGRKSDMGHVSLAKCVKSYALVDV
ncbi:hypothetical protein DdX_12244 [Ditylenchus destructor]|uniref:Uncharacterized protein n=1 Tax=Ditylenchus destructor TaxID=166010 RepID=A0AAD4MXZ8_9BILA|nr:hypothetical protein DdX_12244 [Ditylenchus destructor]